MASNTKVLSVHVGPIHGCVGLTSFFIGIFGMPFLQRGLVLPSPFGGPPLPLIMDGFVVFLSA